MRILLLTGCLSAGLRLYLVVLPLTYTAATVWTTLGVPSYHCRSSTVRNRSLCWGQIKPYCSFLCQALSWPLSRWKLIVVKQRGRKKSCVLVGRSLEVPEYFCTGNWISSCMLRPLVFLLTLMPWGNSTQAGHSQVKPTDTRGSRCLEQWALWGLHWEIKANPGIILWGLRSSLLLSLFVMPWQQTINFCATSISSAVKWINDTYLL